MGCSAGEISAGEEVTRNGKKRIEKSRPRQVVGMEVSLQPSVFYVFIISVLHCFIKGIKMGTPAQKIGTGPKK
jgi:hypothetical protein